MSATCTRLIAFAGPTLDPQDPSDPQLLLVQGRVGVNIEPTIIKQGPAPLAGATDFWDVLVYPAFDKTPYVVLYEAELQDDGTIIVKRDLFGEGDYPVTWSGWPIPGDEALPPSEDPGAAYEELMQSKKAVPATAAEKALSHLKSRRKQA